MVPGLGEVANKLEFWLLIGELLSGKLPMVTFPYISQMHVSLSPQDLKQDRDSVQQDAHKKIQKMMKQVMLPLSEEG